MKAPNFSLPDLNNKKHKLSDYVGKWVVVYFYPKDATPGCTIEACNFRDGREVLENVGAVVLGISKDTVAIHKKFADAHKLNFTLLSDRNASTINKYGAWGKKKLFGREYMGILRNTYLINPKGEIVKTYKNVNPLTHVGELLIDIRELSNKQD